MSTPDLARSRRAKDTTGKVCICGCGQSIEHLRYDAKYHPVCRSRIETERKRAYDRKRAVRTRPIPSLGRRQVTVRNAVDPQGLKDAEPVKCHVCYDMPWARTSVRIADGRDGFEGARVANDRGICRGCGEAWEPEPPIERGEVLRSSAGMVFKHGELHGETLDRPLKRDVRRKHGG